MCLYHLNDYPFNLSSGKEILLQLDLKILPALNSEKDSEQKKRQKQTNPII